MRKYFKLTLLLFIIAFVSGCNNKAQEEYSYTASIEVNCEKVFDNLDKLKKEKNDIIPEDGIIFTNQNAGFKEGETVLDLLKRQLKENKIQFDYESLSGTGIDFVKGINNLYTFDCGEESGWIFKINDEFPLEGCNQIKLKQGDKVEFLYTCDWGIDVGAYVPE